MAADKQLFYCHRINLLPVLAVALDGLSWIDFSLRFSRAPLTDPMTVKAPGFTLVPDDGPAPGT